MIVIEKKPLTLAEAKSQIKDFEDRKALEDYFKKFSNLSEDKALKLIEEMKALNNPKIKDEDISKVADFLPTDAEEVNKIFTDVTLTEDETNKIIEIVKKY